MTHPSSLGKPAGSVTKNRRALPLRFMVLVTALCAPMVVSAQQVGVPLEVWGIDNGILRDSKIWKFRESDEDNDLGTANAADPALDDRNWESVELRWKERPGRDIANHFRKDFTIEEIGVELSQITAIQISVQYDDTAVVYLNGVEVYRSIRGNLDPTYRDYPAGANFPHDVDIDFGGFEEFYVDIPNINGTNDCEQVDDCEDSPYGGPDTPEVPLSLLRDGVNTWGITTWNRSNGGTGDSAINHTFTVLVDESIVTTAPVYINEVMASNDTIYGVDLTGDGELEYPDWIELYNDSDVPVDLEGWTISDDTASWAFPAVSIPAFGHLLIAANDEDRRDTDPLQTNFKLSTEGDTLRLTDPSGFLADEYVAIPEQLDDGTYGRANDVSEQDTVYLAVPTPGATNSGQITNTVPNLNFFADKIFNAGETVSEQVSAFDPDGDNLIYLFSPRPPGLGISADGLIQGVARTPGVYNTAVTLFDNDRNIIRQPLTITVLPSFTGSPAMVLNEYNGVSKKNTLADGGEKGNGGNWFEFVVLEDGLDLRGMAIELYDLQGSDDQLQLAATLTFVDDPQLAALPAGMIITISEDNADDLAFDTITDWHINFQVDGDANGTYFLPGDGEFDSTHKGQAVLIKNAAGDIVSPLSGETNAWSIDNGVSKEEAMALCVDLATGFTLNPALDYDDVSTPSSFGFENTCSNTDGTPFYQNLAALRYEFLSFSTSSTIATGNDDAEERPTGEVSLGSDDLELSEESEARTVGLRFTNLDVPAGARIENAYIQFQAEDNNGLSTQLSIAAQASSNPEQFTSSNNNLSSRALTTTTVNWNPATWTSKGQRSGQQRTPDLTELVKSVVGRSDWARGQSIAFIITGTGERSAESFEGNRNGAANLVIEYASDGNTAPSARVQAATTGGDFPLTVQFTTNGTSDDGFITRYDWDFGDGNKQSAASEATSHTFTEAGDFTARVTVADERGKRSSADVLISVTDPFRLFNTVASISRGDDDAEEDDDGDVKLDGKDLELGEDGSEQLVGLRFNDVAIPKGAVIQNAYIQFQAEDSDDDSTRVFIAAHASSDAAPFSESDNNISSRNRTSAAVEWRPLEWQDKGQQTTDQQTPDISTVLQEVIDRANWDSGQAIAVIIGGTGVRQAESYEGESSGAAQLFIEYIRGAVTPPAGSGDDTLARTIQDTGNVGDDRTASVDNTNSGGTTGTGSDVTNTPTAPAPLPTPTPLPTIQNAQFLITNGEDDAEEIADSRMYLNSSDLELIDDRGPQNVGLRFTGINIPRGAVIQSATIQFTAKESSSGDADLEIAVHASDDAQVFTENSGDISNRSMSDTVNWQPADWNSAGANGDAQRTPELANLVQQIVDRNNWASGNAIAFVITGAGTRNADSYDGNINNVPVLNIDYSFDGNQPPVANVFAQPVTGDAPLTVFYNASQSTDDAGIASYDWVFSRDDGQFEVDGQANPSIIYENPGRYTATVTVTDTAGKSTAQSIDIIVTDPNAR